MLLIHKKFFFFCFFLFILTLFSAIIEVRGAKELSKAKKGGTPNED